jgi:diguanylate cyclase (GGDEF)-like protein/PAS domain S-box-containing protein
VEKTSDFYKALLDNLYDGVYFLDRERRIIYWNSGAERITGYSGDEVLGHCCRDNILMHADRDGRSLCKDFCPAARTMEDGNPAEAEVFLHHKEGHRVPVRTRISPLRDEDGAIIGAVEIFSDNSEKLASLSLIQDLEEKAFQDTLTGLPNRRFLEKLICTRLDEMSRYGWPFGLVFLDIDRFKLVNDSYGHDVGDEVLRMVARTLTHCSRSFDTVGRWGGEEFVAVVVNVDQEKLQRIAERYRVMVESSDLTAQDYSLRITISLGGTLARGNDTLLSLIKRADGLMYRSKQSGRNLLTMG